MGKIIIPLSISISKHQILERREMRKEGEGRGEKREERREKREEIDMYIHHRALVARSGVPRVYESPLGDRVD